MTRSVFQKRDKFVSPIANIVHFYEADFGYTGGSSAVWKDRIGGNDFVKNGSVAAPTAATTPWGAPALDFDSTTQNQLDFTTAVDMTGKTAIWVASNVANGSRWMFAGAGNEFWTYYFGSGDEARTFADGTGRTGPQTASSSATASAQSRANVHMAVCVYDFDTPALTLGWDFSKGATSASSYTPPNFTRIGRLSNSSNSFDGYLYGVVIIDSVSVSDTELETIGLYFSKYYDGRKKTVASSGGDFTTITNAMANKDVSNRYAWSRFDVIVESGTYTDGDADLKQSANIICDGVTINFLQPDSTSAGDIAAKSGINWDKPSVISGITVNAENARYAIHPEPNGDAFEKTSSDEYVLKNSSFTHRGNPSPNSAWTNLFAVGMGTGDGAKYYFEDVTCRSPGTAIGWHDNAGYTSPNSFDFIRLDCDRYTGTTESYWRYARVDNFGSGQRNNIIRMVDCVEPADVFDANVAQWATRWEITDVALLGAYEADHVFKLSGESMKNFYPIRNETPDVVTCKSEVLVLTAAENNNAELIVVSDDSGLLSNGNFSYVKKLGCIDSPQIIEGGLNISENNVGASRSTNNHKMGLRLGDCSVTSKTLVVSLNGVEATATFDLDYTAVSNADILTSINSDLSGVAVATVENLNNDVYRWYSNAAAEMAITNNSNTCFNQGDFVKRVDGVWRKATQGDLSIDGVALETIHVNGVGRVQYRGQIMQDFLNFTGSNIALGDKLRVTSVDGQVEVSANGTIGVGTGARVLQFNV